MKYIHPFPARMAPEIVLNKLQKLSGKKKVLDPMVGSGMVLNTASRLNIQSFGIDIDPLSVLISKVSSTKINENNVKEALNLLLKHSENKKELYLPWIDNDIETSNFIKYWFNKKQTNQLRALAYYLIQSPVIFNKAIIDVIKIAISRLIITKEPKASLARDTAHSRPHKTIEDNDFDILLSLPNSLDSVLKSLNPSEIKCNSKVSIGDARSLKKFNKNHFDMILTSPPYLNAIDYMRGHKFSLVWFGYKISELRNISTVSIGSEKRIDINKKHDNIRIINNVKNLHLDSQMIQRYFIDLCEQLTESYRVLKLGGTASFVIGNSIQKDKQIYNNKILKEAAKIAGFSFFSEVRREIPSNRRYLPINGDSSLSKRMKTEYVITFKKLMNSSKTYHLVTNQEPPHA